MDQDVRKPKDPKRLLIAKNLKRFRDEVGITQQDASDAAMVPIDNLRRYEQGSTTPDAITLSKLAVVYGRTVDDFFQEHPAPARLEERPGFMLRTMPGMELDQKLLKRLQDEVEKANREQREQRERKKKR